METWFSKLLSQPITQAHDQVSDLIQRLAPLFRDIENRFFGGIHGVLDRFEIDIHIKLNPEPKAEEVQ